MSYQTAEDLITFTTPKFNQGILFLTKDAIVFKRQCDLSYSQINLRNSNKLNFDNKIVLLSEVSTDYIIRVPHLLTDDMELLGNRALCGMPEEYNIQPGTIKKLNIQVLVAGENFGMGSSREQAVTALLHAGIKIVLASSFGPIFAKNAAYLGLLTSTNINLADKIQNGTPLKLADFLEGKDPLIQEIILSGGIFKYLNLVNSKKIIKPDIPVRTYKRPMNIWEKRLARTFNASFVEPGDVSILPVNKAYSYVALSGPAKHALSIHYKKIVPKLDPKNIFLFEDHFALTLNKDVAILTQNQRKFAKELKLPKKNYFIGKVSEGGGAGICHRVMLEKINPKIDKVVIATDSHTPTLGVLPIIAIPIGSTFFAAAIAEGVIPFAVGKVMRIEFFGKLPQGLTIRDVQIELATIIKPPPESTVIEFGGTGLNSLSLDQVIALCNMVPEIFIADIAITEPFKAGIDFLKNKFNISESEIIDMYFLPDKGCAYAKVVKYDLNSASPWISLPGKPNHGIPLSKLKNSPKIDKAYIASCTNGLSELKETADILSGKKVAPNTELIIVPSSKAIFHKALKMGYINILKRAGAIVREEFTCGPCIGDGPDALQKEEIAISATNRNFNGRMGDKSAQVYLAGINLVVLSATLGHICNIEEYNNFFQQK